MKILYGVSGEIGRRGTMEDEHAVYENPRRHFFSAEIYDGHGGRVPAQVAAEMLTPSFLHAWESEFKKPFSERRREAALLREAYLLVDAYIVERRIEAGTCAVSLYIIGDRFLVANTGDSRVVIGTESGVALITEDHKPDVAVERSRIEALGGNVSMLGVPRVQGILAISRALGDACLKPYVSSEPRIAEGVFGRENDFAVVACDGVWDVLSSQDVIETVRRNRDPGRAAKEVSTEASSRGSTDNITIIVLDLTGHTSSLENEKMKILYVYDKERQGSGYI